MSRNKSIFESEAFWFLVTFLPYSIYYIFFWLSKCFAFVNLILILELFVYSFGGYIHFIAYLFIYFVIAGFGYLDVATLELTGKSAVAYMISVITKAFHDSLMWYQFC